MKTIYLFIAGCLVLGACKQNDYKPDAYGNFEATEILVAARGNGTLLSFDVEEGAQLKKEQVVGVIDTTQLHLKKQQLLAGKEAALAKITNIKAQIAVQQQQKANLAREKDRIRNLLDDSAATQKQFDDISGQLDVVLKQIRAARTQVGMAAKEVKSINAQIAGIASQIKDYKIINPVSGTVLDTYVKESEMANMGKNLYKIAALDQMNLRVYVSGSQLPGIKIGQKVTVLIDKDEDDYYEKEGLISWISSSAEFTPKVIQTKEERVNFVYAVKVRVANDGMIKIGMPGEVVF
jgi:HlyD family secretion protein